MANKKTYSFTGRIESVGKKTENNAEKYIFTFDSDYCIRDDDKYIYLAKEKNSANYKELPDGFELDANVFNNFLYVNRDSVFTIEYEETDDKITTCNITKVTLIK